MTTTFATWMITPQESELVSDLLTLIGVLSMAIYQLENSTQQTPESVNACPHYATSAFSVMGSTLGFLRVFCHLLYLVIGYSQLYRLIWFMEIRSPVQQILSCLVRSSCSISATDGQRTVPTGLPLLRGPSQGAPANEVWDCRLGNGPKSNGFTAFFL